MFLRSFLLLASVTATAARFLPSSPMDSIVKSMHAKRRLQQGLGNFGSSLSGGTCANGTFTPTDDGIGGFSSAAFDGSFQPVCSCSEEGVDSLNGLADPSNLDLSNITALVDDVNELIGKIDVETENACVNTCEACYQDGTVCAILESTSSSKIAFMDGNLTFDSLFALASQTNDTDALMDVFFPFLEEFSFSYEVCLTYTKGETGKACLSVDLTDWMALYSQDEISIPCDLSYNGKRCSSCSIESASDSQCLTASCPEVTTIDTCAGTGLEGPYQFLEFLYSDSETDLSDLTTGSCDVDLESLGVDVPDTNGGGGSGGGNANTSGAPFTALWAMTVVVFFVAATI